MENKLTIQFEGDIYRNVGDVRPRRIVDNEMEKLYDFFQKNLKKTPGALYRTKPHDMNEGVFIAISSRSRKMALSLTNISDSVLHLQEEIINREKKDIGKEISFGLIQYPSVALNGLQISFFDERLVRLYHIIAPTETLYFDASGSFISPIPSIKNKDGNPRRILIYALTIQHPIGKSPPVAFVEYITSGHNIISIHQRFLKIKEMKTKLFGCSKTPARVVADFSKARLQAFLQEYADENLESYLNKMFKIATSVSSIEKNRKHVCIFVHSIF